MTFKVGDRVCFKAWGEIQCGEIVALHKQWKGCAEVWTASDRQAQARGTDASHLVAISALQHGSVFDERKEAKE